MIARILIPLDGSELSDGILLDVRRLLLSLDEGEVHLLEVVEPLPNDADPIQLRLEFVRRHLERVSADLKEEGVRVEHKVVMGDPAQEILRAVDRLQPGLVAMSTHGRSGLSRWLRGSVAERVLRRSSVPVFLCNPDRESGRTQGTTVRKILVALDGSELASRVLPLVEEFARQYGAEVLLLRVVGLPIAYAADAGLMQPPPGLMTPREGAESLLPHQRRMEAAGLSVRVLGTQGEAAREILRVLAAEDADVLAMTTHGLTGLDRWLFGSIAEKVLRKCPTPLLLLRVAGRLEWEEEEAALAGASGA